MSEITTTSPTDTDTAPRPLSETYAARYYSLIAALATLLVGAIVARLLDMDLKVVLMLAGAAGLQGLSSAIPIHNNVFSKKTVEELASKAETDALEAMQAAVDRRDGEWRQTLTDRDRAAEHRGAEYVLAMNDAELAAMQAFAEAEEEAAAFG